MKKRMLVLLALLLALLLAACAGRESKELETSAPVQTVDPMELDISTWPTEVGYLWENPTPSGKNDMQQLIDLGILDPGLSSGDTCTLGDALKMIQKVHTLRYGQESYLLEQAEIWEETDQELTRIQLAEFLYMSVWEAENEEYVARVQDYSVLEEKIRAESCWTSAQYIPDCSLLTPIGQELVTNCANGYFCEQNNETCPIDTISEECGGENIGAVYYCLAACDRQTGEKLLELDADLKFNPEAVVTVADGADAIWAYYNSIEAPAQWVACQDVTTFDTDILPLPLLNKASTLPEVSCQQLPSQWKGIRIEALVDPSPTGDVVPDYILTEMEIQTIADAGFNFIMYDFDFSYFQRGGEAVLNETRLKELDAIIAACIQRDIHINLSCAGIGGYDEERNTSTPQVWNYVHSHDMSYMPSLCTLWQALVRRYDQIPNKFLSFTLLGGDIYCESETILAQCMEEVVDAIREVSPDRCIIAQVFSGGHTGEAFAKLGVALAYGGALNRDWDSTVYNLWETGRENDYLSWPRHLKDGTYIDADGTLDAVEDRRRISAKDLKTTADRYGVGFMVGPWGMPTPSQHGAILRQRMDKRTLADWLTDMTDTMAQRGYGWCYNGWYGEFGLFCGYPAITDTTYTRVGDSQTYVDNDVFELFQKINRGT